MANDVKPRLCRVRDAPCVAHAGFAVRFPLRGELSISFSPLFHKMGAECTVEMSGKIVRTRKLSPAFRRPGFNARPNPGGPA